MDQGPSTSGTGTKEVGNRVLITRLAPYTKKKDILKLLADQQPVHVVVLRKATGNHAFVTFKKVEQAEAATQLRPLLHKRRLLIEPADPWHHRELPGRKPQQDQLEGVVKNIHTQKREIILPIECIASIAKFLPYADRARLELVSKRWREGVSESFREVRLMSMKDAYWPENWNGCVVTSESLHWLLKRAARFVREVQFSEVQTTNCLRPQIFAIIIKKCNKMTNADFTAMTIRPSAVREIKNAENLRTLKLGPTTVSVDVELEEALKVLIKLESLVLKGTLITGKGLANHPPSSTLKQLELSFCSGLQSRYLELIMQNVNQLQKLTLKFKNPMRTASFLHSLRNNTSLHESLTELEIHSFRVLTEEEVEPMNQPEERDRLPFVELDLGPVQEGLHLVSSFKSISSLALQFCGFVTSLTVEEIATHLDLLQYLNISGCTNIQTPTQLGSLSRLLSLKTLEINYMHPRFGADGVQQLRGLTSLHCRASQGIVEETLCAFIRNCPQLEVLDIESCKGLGKPVLTCAYQVVRMANRLIPLQVFVAGTKVTRTTKLKRNFFLQVDYAHHYEPLFK